MTVFKNDLRNYLNKLTTTFQTGQKLLRLPENENTFQLFYLFYSEYNSFQRIRIRFLQNLQCTLRLKNEVNCWNKFVEAAVFDTLAKPRILTFLHYRHREMTIRLCFGNHGPDRSSGPWIPDEHPFKEVLTWTWIAFDSRRQSLFLMSHKSCIIWYDSFYKSCCLQPWISKKSKL